MKILFIQLARLGDIFLSWPTIRAIRRSHPDAEISVLTRSRFQQAWEGCDAKLQIIPFETKNFLAPVICDLPDIPEAYRRADLWLGALASTEFDRIINLSFSPLSSYITHRLTGASTQQVSGYTRTADGYLAIRDDMSAYFYAQVGPGRSNRFHLAEIFGTLADCDLLAEDWKKPEYLDVDPVKSGIVVHIGASETKKTISATKWATICQQVIRSTGKPLTLIGSADEVEKALTIMNSVSSDQISNCVGKTQLADVIKIIDQGELLIGCDSAPMHIASLTKTPCLNISLPSVNFWETGPRAQNSRIIRVDSEEELSSEKVALVTSQILSGTKSELAILTVKPFSTPSYSALEPRHKEFQWKLLMAIYRGQVFPKSTDVNFHDALVKLEEVNRLALEQLTFVVQGGELKKIAKILEGADSIVKTIATLCESISPLVRWYQTEKLRIPPGQENEVLEKTIVIHELMMAAIRVLMESALNPEVGESR